MSADDGRDATTLVSPFAKDRREDGIAPVGAAVQGGRGFELDGEPPEVLERLSAALDRPVATGDRVELGVKVAGVDHVLHSSRSSFPVSAQEDDPRVGT
jgi:hypothetical protein